MGVWGAVAGSGGAVGVLLGGILTEYAGWEWVLFVNVPIGIAVAFAATRVLAESRDDRAAQLRRHRRRDHGHRGPVAARLRARRHGQRRLGLDPDLALIAIALALIAGFLAIEMRAKSPLVSFRIFRNRTLTGANVVGLLVAMALFAMFFFVSLYMQQVLGYDALKAGLAYLPLAFGIIVSAGVASAAGDARSASSRRWSPGCC